MNWDFIFNTICMWFAICLITSIVINAIYQTKKNVSIVFTVLFLLPISFVGIIIASFVIRYGMLYIGKEKTTKQIFKELILIIFTQKNL